MIRSAEVVGVQLRAWVATWGVWCPIAPWLCCLALGLGTSQACAEDGENTGALLRLRAGTIDLSRLPNLMHQRGAVLEVDGHGVVAFDGPMTAERRRRLAEADIQLGPYLPDRAFVVRLTKETLEQLRHMPDVRWIGRYQAEWKVAPDLGKRPFSTDRRVVQRGQGQCEVLIHLFDDADAGEVVDALAEINAEILRIRQDHPNNLIHAVIPLVNVNTLLPLNAVRYVEEAPEAVPRNDTNEWIAQSNIEGSTPAWDRGLHGEGMVGGLIDWPFNIEHCMVQDETAAIGPDHRKIVAYRGDLGTDTHGTHVVGTYVGDSGANGAHDFRDGIAFAAKVSYSSVIDISFNPETLYDRFFDAQNDGANVHSNSWGDDSTTDYTTWAEQADRYMWDHESSLVCFAVSNQSTIRSPESAKNVLAVAASEDTPLQANHCFGGTGPTDDGRRKPEILAPGCNTFSALASTSCDFASFNGTSYATPLVSGSALLARQYFFEGFYPSGTAVASDTLMPSGALLKAVLLNSAIDMEGVEGFPSDQEGWGRLLLDNALFFEGDARGLFVADVRNDDGLVTDELMFYEVDVQSSEEPLKVTLVWTDAPATVGTDFAPINNLDLVVTSPTGSTYLGNQFAGGASVIGGEPDVANNVEQVLIETPEIGIYEIDVEAADVEVETQGFAVVVTGSFEAVDEGPGDGGSDVPCTADVNDDSVIDGLDTMAIMAGFCGTPPCDDSLDANGDGVVNPLDLGYALARLGDCPD